MGPVAFLSADSGVAAGGLPDLMSKVLGMSTGAAGEVGAGAPVAGTALDWGGTYSTSTAARTLYVTGYYTRII